MTVLKDVAMIAANTGRSKAYLQAMSQFDLAPSFVFVMKEDEKLLLPGQSQNDKKKTGSNNASFRNEVLGVTFEPQEPLENTLQISKIPFKEIYNTDINSSHVIKEVSSRPEPVFIYSGYGGQILRKGILGTEKKFLHVHGGYLPDYKGSTTNYYSLINDNECGASSLFLNQEIDCGSILLRRKFSPPEDKKQLDYIYEPIIRAKVLVETLRAYVDTGVWKNECENLGGDTYYIMHPFLRHVAILAG